MAATLPLSSINLDLINPLSVIVVFGSIKIKSPTPIPNFSTSSLQFTISSILTSMFFSSLGLDLLSSKTWAAGLVLRNVPE